MAPLALIAGVACWSFGVGTRVIKNTVHGYNERKPVRDEAERGLFYVDEEEFDENYLGDLSIINGGVESDEKETNESMAIPRQIRIYYRMLGVTQKSGISSVVRTMSTTSHWGVQVGDLFYELRQSSESENSLEKRNNTWNVVLCQEGRNISLQVVRNRRIVPGSKYIEMGDTQYTDSQIIKRASHIFQHVYSDNFNTWIDNCQSFSMILCECIVPKIEQDMVRETLESKSMLYPTSSLSLALSAAYYLTAGVKSDTDDVFSCLKVISTDKGKERVERIQEGFNGGLDRGLGKLDKLYMHPEMLHARRKFWVRFGDRLVNGYEMVTGRVPQ